ncbi:AAA family ATPase [Photobacterium frigidiphilum]|uniref:AAA family ATPase n=1 Tax=Photobacterium frigidiphilum TaxID=264736 RepID=A0A2T3JLH7_9GAMM|nr:AAA family ATPase [Photobacterium frigidiphilum]PSU49893.1 AAA family ATPase [Photobacterium frigidiphilum]
MTNGSNARELDLDSQIQLLSRIQFLTRFNSNLIQITGTEGAGKTWLAQHYIEHYSQNCNQALLLCHPAQTDSQHRSIVLKQLVNQPLFNDQDPLIQSLERMLEGHRCNVLLIIDDAHLLSPVLIAELWAVITRAQSEPLWQINVLLFSQTGRLNKYLDQVSHGQGQMPLELEISDLTEQEVQTFIEVVLSSDALDANGRRELKEKAALAEPKPRALMQLNNTDNNMANSSSRTLSPLALLVVVLAILTAGVVFWFFPANDEPAPSANNPIVTDTATENLKTGHYDDGDTAQSATTAAQQAKKVALSSSDRAIDDARVLPQEISSEGLTVGRNDDSQRVVVPSQVVDAMLSEQALETTQSNTDVNTTDVNTNDVATASNDSVSPQHQTAAPKLSTQQETSAPVVNVLGEELKGVNSRHYALQLAALQSLSTAQKFIAEHKIQNIATLYETRRKGEAWFIVITGNYKDIVAARRAELLLPDSVQAVQPWVKSYAQIHREIDQAK